MRRVKRLGFAVPAMLMALAFFAGTASATTGVTEWGGTPTSVPGPTGVTALAGAEDTTYALKGEALISWGNNSKGQLGDGECCTRRTPAEATTILTGVVAVSAGDETGLALKSNGTVWAWGSNVQGQLGQGSISGPETCKLHPCSTKPIQVPGLEHIVGISAGERLDLAVSETGAVYHGTVYAWGSAKEGELGNGSTEGTVACSGVELPKGCNPTPGAVSELSEAVAVSAGGFQDGVALLSNGTVKDWGNNEWGQLGNGTTEPSSVPVSVSELSEVTAISAGINHVVALKSDGTARSWGVNADGALGVRLTEAELKFSDTPLTVGGISPLTEVTAIATAGGHTVALHSNGTVAGWGQNELGQVGGESGSEVPVPRVIPHAKEVVGIAAERGASLAFGEPAPLVSTMSRTSGPDEGGTEVEIHGEHFHEIESVKFGGKSSSVLEVSETLIRVMSPAGSVGKVSVSVIGSRGQSGVAPTWIYTSTAATPEFGRCKEVPKETGRFKGGSCLEEGGTRKFEWYPGAVKQHFSGSVVLEPLLETVGKAKVKCSVATFKGEINSSISVAGLKIAFEGCEKEGAGKCSSGATEGEILTSPLEGVLGFESRELNDVAVQLQPEGGAAFAEFSCGTVSARVKGAVIAQLTSPNAMHLTFGLKFKQSKGKQTPTSLEGGPTVGLEASFSGGSYEGLGVTANGLFSAEEELEINTIF